jgi:hypothetical protein
MSRLPFGNNESGVKEIYESRELYEEFYPEDTNQFDLWNALPLYGKVNTLGVAVYPKESQLSYISKSTDKKQLAVLTFVADSFKKMREHYETVFKTNAEVGGTDFFKEQLEPTRAWESSLLGFSDYIQSFYDKFYENVLLGLADSKRIKNFNDFVAVLFDYLQTEQAAFTRMGYNESRNTSVLTTGLAIEIFEGEYGDDLMAYNFTNDPNFPIYDELCRKYGFKIDRNIPWRIIANIKSSNLSPFIQEKLSTGKKDFTEEDVFEDFYENMNTEEFFEEFVNYLKIFYATFVQAYPTYKVENINTSAMCNIDIYKILDRQPANSPNLVLKDEDALLMFYKFRLAELGLTASKKRQSFHRKNMISIFRSFKKTNDATQKVLDYIQFNIGTPTFREESLDNLNLQKLNNLVIMYPQKKFDSRTGEDNKYLKDDFSNT